MLSRTMECVVAAKAALGEGAYWDDRKGRLYWVDVDRNELHLYDPDKGTDDIHSFERKVSAAVPAERGGWILTMEDGIYRYMEHQPVELLAAVETGIPGNRLNDAKCDSLGRLWFGSMNRRFAGRDGSLYVMESAGSAAGIWTSCTSLRHVDT